jgi:REP-associated tyrosine transposase
MPRANRYRLPGNAWHITHRCHRQQFLLKFARDRRCWRAWLFEARKRFNLCVLNYMVTSNHIHLLLLDRGQDEIPRGIQLIAGRTAQAYNQRKGRRGAYWEDRYHATAVEAGEHLVRCLVYIDLNMVRAGVVSHPDEWEVCGYQELQQPPARYCIIDYPALMGLLGIPDAQTLRTLHREWIEVALKAEKPARDEIWSQSLAVGSRKFVENFQTGLGTQALHREIESHDSGHCLREPGTHYGNSHTEITTLTADNMVFLSE